MTPYVSLQEADDYFSTRLNSEVWDDASNDDQIKALMTATRMIDRLNFIGNPVSNTQTNKFPRYYPIHHHYGFFRHPSPQKLIPISDIKTATCEIAINLLDGTDMEQEQENLFVTQETYATVSTQYNDKIMPEWMRAGIPSVVAWNYLKPYLVPISNLSIRRV